MTKVSIIVNFIQEKIKKKNNTYDFSTAVGLYCFAI